MKTRLQIICATVCLLLIPAMNSGAATTGYYGNISDVHEADRWLINLAQTGSLEINVLAYEDSSDLFNNGAGNDLLDASIFFFTASGIEYGSSHDPNIVFNPTIRANASKDGSLILPNPYYPTQDIMYDPYLSYNGGSLSAGNYILTIGTDGLTSAAAWSDIFSDASHSNGLGMYQLSFISSTDITVTSPDLISNHSSVSAAVPIPSSILIFASGLVCLIGFKNKSKLS